MVFFSSAERPIDFLAVADSDNENHELLLFFFEYDSVVPDSQSVEVFFASGKSLDVVF